MHNVRLGMTVVAGLVVALLSGCDLMQKLFPPVPEPTSPPVQVEVILQEWAIVPAQITVQSGSVRFVVHNAGTMAHGFEIEGTVDGRRFEEEIEPFPAGQTRQLEVELAPGRYETYCPVPGHKEQGMVGELIVE